MVGSWRVLEVAVVDSLSSRHPGKRQIKGGPRNGKRISERWIPDHDLGESWVTLAEA